MVCLYIQLFCFGARFLCSLHDFPTNSDTAEKRLQKTGRNTDLLSNVIEN